MAEKKFEGTDDPKIREDMLNADFKAGRITKKKQEEELKKVAAEVQKRKIEQWEKYPAQRPRKSFWSGVFSIRPPSMEEAIENDARNMAKKAKATKSKAEEIKLKTSQSFSNSSTDQAPFIPQTSVPLKTAEPADVLSAGPQQFELGEKTINSIINGITTGNMAIGDRNTKEFRNTLAVTFANDPEAQA